MNLLGKIKHRLKHEALNRALPLPFESRHLEYSLLASADDDFSRPNSRLIDVSLEAIKAARHIDLSWISKRMQSGPYWPDIWPGEHYKLLAGIVEAQNPKRVIEVGTFRGLGALSIKNSLKEESQIITIDLIPWQDIPDTILTRSDFDDGRLRQSLGDLSDPKFFKEFSETLSGCDLLFVDGPKDGIFERVFVEHLSTIRLPVGALVIFDDIRVWNMLAIWRDLRRPKLDMISFGHWTGTGVVDWNG